ncbi:MAG: hypothetical protein M0R39_16875 [Prolixibacteraceae bacterium]|nr:hypothetical protein [Prolixibacteraceae bacterium]
MINAKHNLIKKILPIVILALIVLILSNGLVYANISAGPKTRNDLRALVPPAVGGTTQDRVVGWEQDCSTDLAANRASGKYAGDPRELVNQSAYNESNWLSRKNDPTLSTSNTVPDSTRSIPMQINQMLFLCAIVTLPASGDTHPNSANILDAGNWPNERGPVPDASGYSPNQASRYESNSKINNIRIVSGGGSITGGVGDVIHYDRELNSRYWFASPVDFVYRPTTALDPGDYTLQIEIEFTPIYTYHAYGSGGTSRCRLDSTGDYGDVTYNKFSDCSSTTRTFRFHYTVPAPEWTIKGESSVSTPRTPLGSDMRDAANIVYVKPGEDVRFNHLVYNDGPDSTTSDIAGSVNWTYKKNAGSTDKVATNSDVSITEPRVSGKTNGTNYANTFTIPATAVEGDKYCQRVSFKPDAWNHLSRTGYSNEVCVIVTVPTLQDYEPISTASGDYEKGSTPLPTFSVGIRVNKFPCDRTVAEGASIGTILWNNNKYLSGAQQSYPLTSRCSPMSSPALYTVPITAAEATTMDGQVPPGPGITATTTITSGPPAYDSANGNALRPFPMVASSTINVFEVPYTRFYGGDVYATTGSIYFNSNDPIIGAGAAVDYAAIAVNEYGSPSSRNTYAGLPTAIRRGAPYTAISTNSLKAKWPAGSSPGTNWAYDAVKNALPSSPSAAAASTHLDATTAKGFYERTGNLLINPSPAGSAVVNKITIHAGGNIYIKNNITTSVPLTGPIAFNDATTPIVLLISDDNIYIDKDVTTITAILIARNTIYTCAQNAGVSGEQQPRSGWQSSCRTKLTINGAVGARDIRFSRSIGSRLGTSTTHTAAGEPYDQAQGVSTAAEVINLPAYMYFATPLLSNNSAGGYQSIYNAAPLL